jgi:hypothetical protein
MTEEHEARRTLVKSPPELWAECSDAASLARHLGQFGEIRITRLEPETAVAWEGERVSGTVRLEPSGWGTRVILTARPAVGGPRPEEAPTPFESESPEEGSLPKPEPEPPAEPPREPEPLPPAAGRRDQRSARRRLFARLLGLKKPPVIVAPAPPSATLSIHIQKQERLAPEPHAATDPEPLAAAAPERPAVIGPGAPPEPESPQAPPDDPAPDPEAALTAALDSLGQAHHRPFSRA